MWLLTKNMFYIYFSLSLYIYIYEYNVNVLHNLGQSRIDLINHNKVTKKIITASSWKLK
jgi:hypothetical protein